MADKNILHMLTPTKHTSPFDVNMALDAGYDAVLTYNNVTLDDVTGLVQDAIFSRPPKVGARTGMFFGGKNASLALDMLAKAKKALVPPFGISFFADPAGSFTTAAAMLACVEKLLKEKKNCTLQARKVAVFGATGVVGYAAGVIAALEGANVTLVGYDGLERVSNSAKEIKTRFNIDVGAADGSDDSKKSAILAGRGGGVVCRPRRGSDPERRPTCGGKTVVDRRRRECRSAARDRRPGYASKRQRDHITWHAGFGAARYRQHQIQDRVRSVPENDFGHEADRLRFSRRVCACARTQWVTKPLFSLSLSPAAR